MRNGNKIALILVLLLLAAACGSGGKVRYTVIYSTETERSGETETADVAYTIGMVPKATGNSYFNQVEDGAREAAKELGMELIYEGSPVADTEQQIRSIRSLIARGVNLLAVSANDAAKLAPVLKEAKNNNIRVITWDSDAASDSREWFVNMVDPEVLGRHLMDTLALQMGEEGSYAILTGAAGASNMGEWVKWIKVQNEQYYPRMKLVEAADTGDDSQRAYRTAMEAIHKYPSLGGIISSSSVATPAAAQATLKNDLVGRIHIVGLSTPNLMRSYLHEGVVQNVTLWSPKRLGYLTVVLAKNLLDGKDPVNGESIRNVGEIRVKGDRIIMGEPLDFTKSNVDEYDF